MPRTAATTTPLPANQVWNSGSLAPGLSDYITGSVFVDQPGTLFIEQSPDGNNWDISTSYAISANDGKGFSESVLVPYVRVRYVNGNTNQGVFRLSTRTTSAGPR